MLYYLVTALYILVCFTMMLVVYLQQGKGGDIASAFGGASSQAAFGARSGATVLSRATWVCAAIKSDAPAAGAAAAGSGDDTAAGERNARACSCADTSKITRLVEADLVESDLVESDLVEADLVEADLVEADLVE